MMIVPALRKNGTSQQARAASIRGWVNHARHGNTVGLRKAVLGKIRLKLPKAGPR